MANEINKPLSVKRAEFITQMTNLIKNSNLPVCVIEPIIKDFFYDIKIASQKELENDLRLYQESISKQQSNSENS